jgi:hypothetical protein
MKKTIKGMIEFSASSDQTKQPKKVIAQLAGILKYIDVEGE